MHKTYNIGTLARAYGVSRDTFKAWLEDMPKEVQKIKGKVFTPRQIKIIIEHAGDIPAEENRKGG